MPSRTCGGSSTKRRATATRRTSHASSSSWRPSSDGDERQRCLSNRARHFRPRRETHPAAPRLRRAGNRVSGGLSVLSVGPHFVTPRGLRRLRRAFRHADSRASKRGACEVGSAPIPVRQAGDSGQRQFARGLTSLRRESVGRTPITAQDRARRLGAPGQLAELAGQRRAASSQRGPATGHGFATRRRRSTRESSTSVLSVAIAALCLATACGRARRTSFVADSLRGWNVLLVTIDTLRADHVGAYGNQLGLTPTIDRLAREGVRFTHAYAHVPLALPSHTT